MVKMEETFFWSSRHFLEKILQESKQDVNLSICKSSVENVGAKGDNYISKLFRIVVRLENPSEKNTLFVKVLPDEGIVRDMIAETSTFSNEIKMYRDTLPEMDKVLDRIASSKIQNLWPKCYYLSSAEEQLVLIIEDLNERGYVMADRRKGLDLDHCLLVMKTIARFHACSLAVHAVNPSFIESYTTNMFFEDSSKTFWEQNIRSTFTTVAEEVRKWENFGDRFAEKLHARAGTIRDDLVSLMRDKSYAFKVLVHGDLWLNNVLFRYKEGSGEPENAMLIDFQFCLFTSPGIDFQYFLSSSPTEEVRVNHSEDLLRAYHSELCDMLQLFGQDHQIITFQQVLEEYERTSLFGAFVTFMCVPVMLSDPSDAFDFERALKDETDEDAIVRRTVNEPYAKLLRRLLPEFERKGLI